MRNTLKLFVLQYCLQDSDDYSATECSTQNQVLDGNNEDEVIWVVLHVYCTAFMPIYSSVRTYTVKYNGRRVNIMNNYIHPR